MITESSKNVSSWVTDQVHIWPRYAAFYANYGPLSKTNIHKIFNISGLAQIDSKTVEDIFKGVLQTPDPAVQPPPGKSYTLYLNVSYYNIIIKCFYVFLT